MLYWAYWVGLTSLAELRVEETRVGVTSWGVGVIASSRMQDNMQLNIAEITSVCY